METRNRRAFRLRACQTCGGDAYLDISDTPEWRCLQCGRQVSENATPVAAIASRHVQISA